jgi:hypothetical protein
MCIKIYVKLLFGFLIFCVSCDGQTGNENLDNIRIFTLDKKKELRSLSNNVINTLPNGHLPECNYFNSDKIAIHDFSESLLPVRAIKGSSIDIIDKNGETVKNIKGFSNVGLFEGGHYLCNKVIYNRLRKKEEFNYNYLNEDFEPIFKNRNFTYATPFSNDKALVQEDYKLIIIDSKGNTLVTLPDHLTNNFQSASKIINNILPVKIKIPKKNKKGFHSILEYYDVETKSIIRADDGNYFGSEVLFPDEIGVAYDSKSIKSFNKYGEILKTVSNFEPSSFRLFNRKNSNYFIYKDTSDNTILADKYLTEVNIDGKSISEYDVILFNDKVISVKNKSQNRPYLICNPQTLEVIHESDFPAISKVNDYYVLAYKRGFNFFYKGILNSDKINYIDSNDYWFTNLEEALLQSEKVINLDVMPANQSEFSTISNFMNLKHLKLTKSKFEVFNVDFSNNRKLEELNISVHNKLKEIPESLMNHPTLKKLSIRFCPKVANLEKLVVSLSGLESLNIRGLELSSKIIAQLRKNNPNISINISEDPVFEDIEIEATEIRN